MNGSDRPCLRCPLAGASKRIGFNMRRNYFHRGMIAIAVVGLMLFAWGYINAGAAPIVRKAEIRLSEDQIQRPLKVLLIADLHVAEPDTSPARIARLIAQANALRPDIVLFAGDFVAHKRLATSKPGFADAIAPLKDIKAPLGAYAVLGNHDHWRNAAEAKTTLERVGVRVLDNEAVQAGSLVIGGVDDAFTGHDDVDATVKAMKRLRGVKILISHSPDVMPEVPADIPLVVAGHTHCGQIALPFFGPIVTMSRFGQRYACGLVREDDKTLVVTAGIGTSLLPIRFNAPPDMWLITIN